MIQRKGGSELIFLSGQHNIRLSGLCHTRRIDQKVLPWTIDIQC